MKIFASFDIGWKNLAFLKAVIDENVYKIIKIITVKHICLDDIIHEKIKWKDCQLKHSNDAFDKMSHFFQEYHDLYFGDVDRVIIERQPIQGLTHIEQLLFGHFRDKAELISPRGMHSFFHITNYDYETRKKITTDIATPYLKEFQDWIEKDRLHDMGDCFCYLIYHLHLEKQKNKKQAFTNTIQMAKPKNICHFLEQFKNKKEEKIIT
jgi:hypothetical protein